MRGRIGVRDVGLAAFVLVLQSVPFIFSARYPGHTWTLTQYAPVLLTAIPLVWRRSAPLSCMLVIVLGVEMYAFLGEEGPSQTVWYGGLIAIYTVGLLGGHRQRIVAMVVVPIGVLVAVGSIATGVRETLTWGAAYALGSMTRTRRRLEADGAAKSAELAAERERTRIARDLHDILGHAFSVMVVQAEAGAMTTEPGSTARTTFRTISAAGREAMTQLRVTVGTLRAAEPSLADLNDLVRRAGRGDVPVTLTVTGEPCPLAPSVQAAGYRVVQEALTNSLKHSGATAIDVTVQWRDGEVRLTVVDDGTGSDTAVRNGGTGLESMSARAADAGGRVGYGPRPAARGFVVEAVFG